MRTGSYGKRIVLLVSVTCLWGCHQTTLHTTTHALMGTFVEVVSPDERSAGIVFEEMSRIEKLLSKYDPASEISRFNQTGYLKASNDTLAILKKAREFWSATGGAFDVTVGPLLDIWGFTDKQYRRPTGAEISIALAKVGMDKLIFDDADQSVRSAVPGVKVDLGGIAKGYALDSAAKKLRAFGIRSCLINAGGQVYAIGQKTTSSPWVIGIRDPSGKAAKRRIPLTDQSAATSGDYEQYFTDGRSRYAHIFNPKTGYPVATDIHSVTVIASDGATADALSTSVFVLGREKGDSLTHKFPGATAIIQ